MMHRVLWGIVLVLAACDEFGSADGGKDDATDDPTDTDATGADDDVDDDTDPAADGLTWHDDVRPIVEQSCLGCHNTGGIAPIDFTYDPAAWADGPPWWVGPATAAVESGQMPPWPAADGCRDMKDSRKLSQLDIDAFLGWADAGFPEGEPSTFQPRGDVLGGVPAELGEPDLVLTGDAAYTPRMDPSDEYRCFVLPVDIDRDIYLRGINIVPDQRELVHHAILYQFLPQQTSDIADAKRRDEADDGPGYDCWGNPLAQTLMTWAPGQVGQFMPDGVAQLAPEGGLWILQIHYNTLGRDEADVHPDLTAVQLWTYEEDEAPDEVRLTVPVPQTDLYLPAGDPDVEVDFSFDLSILGDYADLIGGIPIVGAMGHLHQLGTSFALSVEDDAGESCLLDIPAWDFHWQMAYEFDEADWVYLGPGSSVEMTCRYDNSADNQVVVDGVQLEPRDVRWGEGTRDEMCLGYVTLQAPQSLVELLLDYL